MSANPQSKKMKLHRDEEQSIVREDSEPPAKRIKLSHGNQHASDNSEFETIEASVSLENKDYLYKDSSNHLISQHVSFLDFHRYRRDYKVEKIWFQSSTFVSDTGRQFRFAVFFVKRALLGDLSSNAWKVCVFETTNILNIADNINTNGNQASASSTTKNENVSSSSSSSTSAGSNSSTSSTSTSTEGSFGSNTNTSHTTNTSVSSGRNKFQITCIWEIGRYGKMDALRIDFDESINFVEILADPDKQSPLTYSVDEAIMWKKKIEERKKSQKNSSTSAAKKPTESTGSSTGTEGAAGTTSTRGTELKEEQIYPLKFFVSYSPLVAVGITHQYAFRVNKHAAVDYLNINGPNAMGVHERTSGSIMFPNIRAHAACVVSSPNSGTTASVEKTPTSRQAEPREIAIIGRCTDKKRSNHYNISYFSENYSNNSTLMHNFDNTGSFGTSRTKETRPTAPAPTNSTVSQAAAGPTGGLRPARGGASSRGTLGAFGGHGMRGLRPLGGLANVNCGAPCPQRTGHAGGRRTTRGPNPRHRGGRSPSARYGARGGTYRTQSEGNSSRYHYNCNYMLNVDIGVEDMNQKKRHMSRSDFDPTLHKAKFNIFTAARPGGKSKLRYYFGIDNDSLFHVWYSRTGHDNEPIMRVMLENCHFSMRHTFHWWIHDMGSAGNMLAIMSQFNMTTLTCYLFHGPRQAVKVLNKYVPDWAALTICEFLEYLPQRVDITFEPKQRGESRLVVDCVDLRSNLILMHESKQNTKEWHCVKLDLLKMMDSDNLSFYDMFGMTTIDVETD